MLLYCEQQFKRVKGFAGIVQAIANVDRQNTWCSNWFRQRRQRETTMGTQEISTDLLTTFTEDGNGTLVREIADQISLQIGDTH